MGEGVQVWDCRYQCWFSKFPVGYGQDSLSFFL